MNAAKANLLDNGLSDLPFVVPNTRRRIDRFLECAAFAIRGANECRVLADDDPALREILDVARWLLGDAVEEALAIQERTWFEHGVYDLSLPEAASSPPDAVVASLVRHADTVSRQVGQDAVRDAVIDAARAIAPLLGDGGISRRVAARVIANAAASAGVHEAAAAVWALEVFRQDEVVT